MSNGSIQIYTQGEIVIYNSHRYPPIFYSIFQTQTDGISKLKHDKIGGINWCKWTILSVQHVKGFVDILTTYYFLFVIPEVVF